VREIENYVMNDWENSQLDEALTENKVFTPRNTHIEKITKGKQDSYTPVQSDDNEDSSKVMIMRIQIQLLMIMAVEMAMVATQYLLMAILEQRTYI